MNPNNTSILARFFLPLFFCVFAGVSFAQDIPWADSAEEVGMSTERLERINTAMQRHIEAGTIQGAVTAVARRGKLVHLETHGLMSVPKNRPMQDDSLFIMMSSTKPVLGVAAMMLVEEGLIRPTDPISKWFPEFAEMQVAVLRDPVDEDISPIRVNPLNVPAHRLVPAAREITVHDILTHTSGLASSGLGSAISADSIGGLDNRESLAKNVPEYGNVVLDFQPGSRWQYSPATALDVIARIIEIESGIPFDEFVKERIFEPLGMNDTFWNVPEEYQDRLIEIIGADTAPPAVAMLYDTSHSAYYSGSYGLKSTAGDYLRFEQMLVNGGELFGNRLLSPRTVRMMSSNQTKDLFSNNVEGQGFGYTVATSENPIVANQRRAQGAFGWGGALGTRSWSDPEEELTAVIMIQQPVPQVQRDFENAVQQAIIE
ncbi:MAG TPA: serine hydrolase domain-containing protein [Gammaproteobacteria bacterium]|jgi:CubicO group peptidase (beta-lactamase class C family)|nr:serine hydrolase domain-containing protein [Gammaproteobacteria bacterium]|tara:strand:+ start:810 stop:2099 length:1290 start_codon:yes stop_codon:yes gene_type:complete